MIPTLFWLTGLSGAGKTTIATLLTEALRQRKEAVIFLDGDKLRELYDNTYQHDYEGRLAASMAYAKLCRLIVAEQIHVVCATISLFHVTQQWNRLHQPHYLEILIDVPLEQLKKRDSKGIYRRQASGELNNVVGIDIPAEFPLKPDLIISNHGSMTPGKAVNRILQLYENQFAQKFNVLRSNQHGTESKIETR